MAVAVAALVGWLAMLASALVVARWVVASRVRRVSDAVLEQRIEELSFRVRANHAEHDALIDSHRALLDAAAKRLERVEERAREADRQLASLPARRRA